MSIKIAQLLFAAALLVGVYACNETDFNPGPGSSNVRVDAVPSRKYVAKQFARSQDILNTGLIHLKLKPKKAGLGNPQTQTSPDQTATNEADKNKKDSTVSSTDGVDVPGRVAFKHKCVPNKETSPAIAPCKENELLETEVFFIPIVQAPSGSTTSTSSSASSDTPTDTPLLPGRDYCFHTEEVHQGEKVKGQNNNAVFQADQSCFTTEDKPTFSFFDNATMMKVTTPAKLIKEGQTYEKKTFGDDILVFELDNPIRPESLKAGTHLCQKDASTTPGAPTSTNNNNGNNSDSQNTCDIAFSDNSPGSTFNYDLFQIEDFKKDPKSGFYLAGYQRYGIKTKIRMHENTKYAIVPGLGEDGDIDTPSDVDNTMAVDDGNSRFTSSSRTNSSDPTLSPSVAFLQLLLMNENDGPAIFSLRDTKK